jgi:hypothetical protein
MKTQKIKFLNTNHRPLDRQVKKQIEIMRKVILIIALVVTNTIFAQSVFDKFDNQDDITTVIVNKKMFSMLSKVDTKDKQSQQYLALIKKLNNLKVFVTANSKKSNEMRATADKYVKTTGLDELMRINEKGKNVKIYVKSGAIDSQVKELLMFIEGSGKEQSVLMSLTGNFDLDELSALTDKMNLPGGAELKKASKK